MPLWLLLFWLFLTPLWSLDVVINSGKEEGKSFAVLNLVHDQLFPCKEEINRHGEVEQVICLLEGKPSTPFTQSNTLFFKVETKHIDSSLYLVITPKKRAKLFALHVDPRTQAPLLKEEAKLSKRWQVVGYEEKIPFLKDKKSLGINFPIAMEGTTTPFIGALDVFKKPLIIESGNDVPFYLSAKSLMERHSYKEALAAIDEALVRYPETIFKRDLLLFKIRAMEALSDPESMEDLVGLAKSWSRAYPSDASIPEVLYVLAKAYGNMRFFDEARYYYERLFSEHKGDNFELLAKIALADELLKRGDNKRAPQLYTDALNESKNLETASLAAVRLADYQISKKNFKEAESLLLKVLEANPSHFQKEPSKIHAMLERWVDQGFYGASARIAEELWKSKVEDDDLDERLIRQAGIWYEAAERFDDAHRIYRLYKEKYANRSAIKEIIERDDKLLFVLDENNATKRLERLDHVIKSYPGTPEERRAYERKAETYAELGEYLKVLEIERHLDPNHPALLLSATKLAQEALKKEDCKSASFYLQKYSSLALGNEEKIQGFDCLMKSSLLAKAQELAQEGIALPDLSQRLEWLYRYAKVLEASMNFPRATLAARDTLVLANSLKKPQFSDIAFVLFNALVKQNREEEAREVFARLQKQFPEDNRMIEAYKSMLVWASKRLDETAIEIYAKELLRLQKLHTRPEYSPWVELTYIESLLRTQRFKEALGITEELSRLTLEPEERIKTLYIRGSIAQRLDEKALAKESFEQCSKVEGVSAWKNLCAEALKLLN